MVEPAFIAAFLLGALLQVLAMQILDRRAIQREAEFWEELRLQALDGYGSVFDWEQECREFGCHDEEPA